MVNLWEFLFQSLTASMIAAIILIIKYIFKDKLSASWHYGVWGALALRIIVPVSGGKGYTFLPLELWIETLKGAIESGLNSSYSGAFEPMRIRFSFPVVYTSPVSITDWIFVIYLLGVIVFLARYILNYIKLRILLNKGAYISIENQQLIDSIALQYNLNSCKAVEVEGVPSPFVCGILRPILVIPSDKNIDKKIILHELLHLKYKDAMQSILWALLRSIHWCNPFIHFIFNKIENDMEILCDYRVLERLEGEEKREYGNILLSMANKEYPHAPGTTSISNGGKNIARRIISITRFKHYPKDMSIVSICISVILIQYLFFGAKASGIVFEKGYSQSQWSLHQALASARVNRCTTIAGALDTYAKGIFYNNGLYIATASPLGSHEELAERMMDNIRSKNTDYYYLDGELPGEASKDAGVYGIYNLVKTNNDVYRADIVFRIDNLFKPETYDGIDSIDGLGTEGFVVYPVTITYEDSWVVTRAGEQKIYPIRVVNDIGFFRGNKNLPPAYTASGQGETGTVEVSVQTIYYIHESLSSNDSEEANYNTTTYHERPMLDAKFSSGRMLSEYTYSYLGPKDAIKDITTIGILSGVLTEVEEVKELGKWELEGHVNGWGDKILDENWDGTIRSNPQEEIDITNNKIGEIPLGFTMKVYFDGDLKETITLKEVEIIE